METFNQVFGLQRGGGGKGSLLHLSRVSYEKKKPNLKKFPVSNLSAIQLDFKIHDLGVGGRRYILNPCFLRPAR